ncbi:F-box/kelch-repeat protein At3g23880-like [Lathyrus oleraceus]|uniref:F-box/kelch-repeat protein At3g23880-like n=1 Tax=Pisum sativum TaxID=3888 RepID=UPI0021D0A3F3|nr:F-box/kelch-repeat protein At3g23880-like [Pisum sativum]
MTTDYKGNGQNDSARSSQSSLTSTEETTTNSLHLPHLPFDLVVEILCRLPVKHLLQLRCLCKSWNSLISGDSKFAKKHLRLSTSNQERHHLIGIPKSTKELVLCHSPISSIFCSASTTCVELFSYSLGDILIKGGASTCDGIICFRIGNSLALLCNPFIKKFKILPPLKFPPQVFTIYTIVYDRFTNNYKIIAVDTPRRKVNVNVHTLGTDYWRRISGFPGSDLIPMPRPGIFVNDSVNWLALDDVRFASIIVSLDLEKESYQKLPLPSLPAFYMQFTTSFRTLGTLRGCLSLLFDRRDRFSDVWIMKEYGNEKSWTKLLTVPPMEEPGFYGFTMALYISKDDQVLMEFLKKKKYSLVVYDSINNTFNIPKFQNNNHGEMVAQEVYIESLISPL